MSVPLLFTCISNCPSPPCLSLLGKLPKRAHEPDDASAEAAHQQSLIRQLTEREIEVLKLIAQQYTSEEIAKKLYIARSTVDTYRKNLIAKLKVRNAVGLALFAERNGML